MIEQDFIYIIATPNFFDGNTIFTTIIDLRNTPTGKDKMMQYLNHQQLYPNVKVSRGVEYYFSELVKNFPQSKAKYSKWKDEVKKQGEKKLSDCKQYFKSRLTSCNDNDITRVAEMFANDVKNVQIRKK